MLDSKAAVAAIGSLKKLPSYSDIEIGLLDKDVRQLALFSVRTDGYCVLFAGLATIQEKVQNIQMRLRVR